MANNLQHLAAAYCSSDENSSDAADTLAADMAFEAALDHRDAVAMTAAEADVRRRLTGMGIIGPASIHLMAKSEFILRLVAVEVLGPDYADTAWFALLRVWSSSSFDGRSEISRRSRALPSTSSPLASVMVCGLPVGADGDSAAQYGVIVPAPPPVPAASTVHATAAMQAGINATRIFLAATSTGKRPRPATPLPPMVPLLPGHKQIEAQWEKVVGMYRDALTKFGDESPRYVELFRGGSPTDAHLALQEDVYRDRLQNPATVRGICAIW